MKCPTCNGSNFDWAERCDHCGALLGVPQSESEPPDRQTAPEHPAGNAATDDGGSGESTPISDLALTRRAVVTPLILGVNVALYGVMVARGVSPFSPSAELLVPWGANYRPLTTNGEWWRLITAVFVHSGAVHLALNMFALWYAGGITESLFGRPSFISLYLLSGIGGTLASLVWHPFSVGVGASGAIFGVYGALIAFLTLRHRSMRGTAAASVASGAIAMVFYNLVFGLFRENVDVAAHVGGVVTGTFVGALLAAPIPFWVSRTSMVRAAVVTLVCGAAAVGVAKRIPPVDDLPAAWRRVGQVETTTVARYGQLLAKLQKLEITREQFADTVEKELMPGWEAARHDFAKVRTVPAERERVRQVSEYMAARGEAFRLMAEAVRTGDQTALKEAQKRAADAQALAATLTKPPPGSGLRARAGVATLHGTIRSLAGPTADAVVSLHCVQGSPTRILSSRYLATCETIGTRRSNSEGQFEFDRIPTGPYIARVKAPGYADGEVPLELTTNMTIALTLSPAVDLGKVLEGVRNVERDTVARFNASMKRLQARKIPPEEFTRVVEKEVLPPWEQNRDSLRTLQLAQEHRPLVERLDAYMTLRAEAWRLTAEAVRKNDPALLRRAKSKHDSALKLAAQWGASRSPKTSPK